MSEKTQKKLEACHADGACQDQTWSANFSTAGAPLLPHTDGYVYGDHLPDVIFLLYESRAETGGENMVVDGESVLRRLRSDTTTAPLLELAHTARCDLTERLVTGGITTGRDAFGPVFRRRDDGAIWWRRQLKTTAYELGVTPATGESPSRIKAEVQSYQSLWAPAGAENQHDATQAMLEAVDVALQRETHTASRFSVPEGSALLVDNYRVLHGREGYRSQGYDTDRKVWRIWAWTDRSYGLPEGMAEVGSPFDAETLLQHKSAEPGASDVVQ